MIHSAALLGAGCSDMYMFTACDDNSIKQSRIVPGRAPWTDGQVEVLRSLEGHKMDVTELALHDGHLYSGSNDGTVRTWYVGGGGECPQLLHLFQYPMRSDPRSEGEVRALGLHLASKRSA